MRSDAASQFVEQVGLMAEEDGLPRIAGRIFARLLLADAPCSLDDLADELAVSKASVSTNARLMLRHGWLRRVVRPGDRRDFYEMVPDFFAAIVAFRVHQWQVLYQLAGGALANVPGIPRAGRARLEYLQEVQEFFMTGLQARLAEWQRQQHLPAATPRPRRARATGRR